MDKMELSTRNGLVRIKIHALLAPVILSHVMIHMCYQLDKYHGVADQTRGHGLPSLIRAWDWVINNHSFQESVNLFMVSFVTNLS